MKKRMFVSPQQETHFANQIVMPVRKKNMSMMGVRREHPFVKAGVASVSPPKFESVSLR